MKRIVAICAAAIICHTVFPAEIKREPQMALPERVAAANLIVLGKFGFPGNMGKHTTTSVKVDAVLRGSVPSGKTLWVSRLRQDVGISC
jgi:hypothetical protein